MMYIFLTIETIDKWTITECICRDALVSCGDTAFEMELEMGVQWRCFCFHFAASDKAYVNELRWSQGRMQPRNIPLSDNEIIDRRWTKHKGISPL